MLRPLPLALTGTLPGWVLPVAPPPALPWEPPEPDRPPPPEPAAAIAGSASPTAAVQSAASR